jgi:hypothetical protein
MIDTMAYDRGKNVVGFSEFFKSHLANEREISKFNPNTKIPIQVLNAIKHDYGANGKGLFSNDKVMAFIFVFEYGNDKSFFDMIELFQIIISFESNKGTAEEYKIVKCFLCNKYPFLSAEHKPGVRYEEIVQEFINSDIKTREYVNKVQSMIESNRQMEFEANKNNNSQKNGERKLVINKNEAKENFFFSSAKHNIGVKNCLNSVFNKINQKEKIWKRVDFDDREELNPDDDLNGKEETGGGFLFCCRPRKKITDNNEKELSKSIANEINKSQQQENPEDFIFKDEPDEPGYDMNFVNKPKKRNENKEGEEEGNKEDKNSGCIIF